MRVCGRKPNFLAIAVIVGVHAVAFYAISRIFTQGFSSAAWIMFAVMYLLPGFGMTLGYHRMLTHQSFTCGKVLRFLLLIFGGMVNLGHAYEFAATHRVHHYQADKDGDPHSPLQYPGVQGFLWAHLGWIFFVFNPPERYRRFKDLDEDPIVLWQKKWFFLIMFGSFIIPFLVAGWDGLLLAGFLRTVVLWHVTASVNSVCHLWGTRAKDSLGREYRKDESRNNILIALLALGEGNHANHHARQSWAYHGWRWYDIDPSKWVLAFLERLHLVANVRKPSFPTHFKA